MKLLGVVAVAEPVWSPPSRAAWIEIFYPCYLCIATESPPSRAAWIEIVYVVGLSLVSASPPSRAAWIEMTVSRPVPPKKSVAAFTGGVD